MCKLELIGLRKTFADTVAVKDLSLRLKEGEFVSLLGPSGCGKSTTLDIVAGFQTPDRGDIVVDGESVRRRDPKDRGIGIVFQDYAVFSHLTVHDNLAFGLEVKKEKRANRELLVRRVAEQLDLTQVLRRRGRNLDMSEMQRVALGRVLVTEPELLLLDEPMSNLDAVMRTALRTELKQIQTALGQTILYVTHDQAEALSMSDQVAVMRNGEILQLGSPEQIYAYPNSLFVAEFIGDPPMNVLAATLRRDNGVVADLACGGSLRLAHNDIDAKECWLGIRPHDISVVSAEETTGPHGKILFVENFGYEWVTHVDCQGVSVQCATQKKPGNPGEILGLAFDLARIHLFDIDTGVNIGSAGAMSDEARHGPEERSGSYQ